MGFDKEKLHTLTEEQYNQRLFESIGASEGFEKTAKDIGDGVATIGYGHNLNARSNNLTLFEAAGITLTNDQKDAIKEIDKMVKDKKSNEDITKYATDNLSTLELSQDDGKKLFAELVKTYETKAIRDNVPLSEERVALVNIAYNTPARLSSSRAPELVKAIEAGDRAATYYHLRFPEDELAKVDDKYKVGILNRHFDASNSFGYANAGENNLDDLKAIKEFFEDKKEDVEKYFENVFKDVTNEKSFRHEQNLDTEINDIDKQIEKLDVKEVNKEEQGLEEMISSELNISKDELHAEMQKVKEEMQVMLSNKEDIKNQDNSNDRQIMTHTA